LSDPIKLKRPARYRESGDSQIIETVPLVNADGEKMFVQATPDLVTPPAVRRKPTGTLFDPFEPVALNWEMMRDVYERVNAIMHVQGCPCRHCGERRAGP
jgi:hypothetical protein